MSIAVSTDRSLVKKPHKPIDIPSLTGYQSIYKYISLDSARSWNYIEQTIKERKMFGSTNKQLNDPFESNPSVIDDISENVVHDALIMFDDSEMRRDLSGSEKYKSKSIDYYKKLANDALKNTIDNLRILSFCDTMASPLLWAHYANAHKGAVLHFSAGSFFVDDTKCGLVQYSRQRPSFPLSLGLSLVIGQQNGMCAIDQLKLRSEIYRAIAFTKPDDWSYEGEFRVCYMSSRITNVIFQPGGLKEIICGSRMSDEDFTRLREIANGSSDNIEIKRATLSNRTFSVEVSE